MSSGSGVQTGGSAAARGPSSLLAWLLVRDRTDRRWLDSLPQAELEWLLTATQTRNTSLSAQAAALLAPLGVAVAALVAAANAGVSRWYSIPALLCLALAGIYLALSISRGHHRLLILDRPFERSDLLKDEAAAIHEKAVLLQRATLWFLLGAVGVVVSGVAALSE